MISSFRFLQPSLLLLGLLASATSGLAQPQRALQPQPALLPTIARPSQPASIAQLRDRFMIGCMAWSKEEKQRSYCSCVFGALMRRYPIDHYLMMDNLIVTAGLPVSQFARLAWGPEFSACRISVSSEAP